MKKAVKRVQLQLTEQLVDYILYTEGESYAAFVSENPEAKGTLQHIFEIAQLVDYLKTQDRKERSNEQEHELD